MPARWWDSASELLERALKASPDRRDVSRYRFGYGRLELDSDDEPLNLRFRQIYPEGMVDPGGTVRALFALDVRSVRSKSRMWRE